MLDREYAHRIIDNCYIDYYLSASYDGGRIHWPWRMFPPSEAYERYVDKCDVYIMDSEFNDPDVTNQDVLDKAVDVGADMVVLEDVYQDFAGTVERVLEGFEVADSHAFDGEVIAPLQEPYVECYNELGRPDKVAIGGLKDASDSKRIDVLKRLRREAGEDTYIHGLGWGATDRIIRLVRNNPDIIDSIDSQTEGAKARKMDYWGGDEQSTPIAAWILGNLLEKCRRMSPHPDMGTDTTLGDW